MSIRSVLKRSPLYPYWFARQHALPSALTDEQLRYSALYANFVQAGSLVFDVGANIGIRSRVFRHLACRVVAVEPQRLCVAALRRSFGDTIEIVTEGVSDRKGEADLHCSDATVISSLSSEWMAATKASGRFKGFDWDKRERIALTTLDALIDRFGKPDFIKIDIEGHELSALRGLSKAVPALSFEFTPETRETAIACVDRLQALSSYKFNFSAGETAQLSLPEWLDRDDIASFFTSNPDNGDVYAQAC